MRLVRTTSFAQRFQAASWYSIFFTKLYNFVWRYIAYVQALIACIISVKFKVTLWSVPFISKYRKHLLFIKKNVVSEFGIAWFIGLLCMIHEWPNKFGNDDFIYKFVLSRLFFFERIGKVPNTLLILSNKAWYMWSLCLHQWKFCHLVCYILLVIYSCYVIWWIKTWVLILI